MVSAVLAQLQNTKKDQILAKESSLNTLDNMHHPATKLSNLVNAYICKSDEGMFKANLAQRQLSRRINL